MRRALLVAAAAVLVAVPAARANGDPASDVLITNQVYIGPEVPVPQSDQEQLTKTVAAANDRGYPIRVALIAFTGDLGTADSLWRHPQDYARFLGSELAFVYRKRLLIAMPSGFGVYHGRTPVARERRALAAVPAGKTPVELTRSTTRAVRALAAQQGIELPTFEHKSTATRDRLLIAAAGVLFLLVVLVPGRWLRRSRAITPEPD
ncbi:MAG TPA: hypothetical protein VLD13_04110 [Gaiellaceae bacterium]|nr:hypothetical protein [Gaiellaceae bacterium]